MRCSELKEGMLLQIHASDMRGWFNVSAHQYAQERYEDIPIKFTIGPDAISFLVRLKNNAKVVDAGEPIMYLGKKLIVSKAGKRKNVRMVLVNGQSGYIEGHEFRYLSPLHLSYC